MTAAGERLDRAPAARAPVPYPSSIPRRARAAVLLLALLPAVPAPTRADGHDERSAPREQEVPSTGPYLGPRHGWAEEPIHRRVLHDLVAIPGSLVWGAAMGWHVGRWVVAHRASPRGTAPARARVRLAPVPLRGGGAGFVLRVDH